MTITKQTQLALVGLVSGSLCAVSGNITEHIPYADSLVPGLIFGLAVFLGLKQISHQYRYPPAISVLALVAVSALGWSLALHLGYEYGGFVGAGALGALPLAIAIPLLLKRATNQAMFVLIVTLAGALGGFIFIGLDQVLDEANWLWTVSLFVEWQIVVLLGVGFALEKTGQA